MPGAGSPRGLSGTPQQDDVKSDDVAVHCAEKLANSPVFDGPNHNALPTTVSVAHRS